GQVMHFGDDQHTDFAAPRKLGIKAVLLCDARLGMTEKFILRERGVEPLRASRVAGAIRAFRASARQKDGDNFHELVASFLGPFLVGFVSWVLYQAQRDGVERLYFLSRDCQLAHKIAQILSPRITPMDCRYLYHSRQAIYMTLAQGVDEREMWWMRR